MIADAGLGFFYRKEFCKSALEIKAGWENHIYFGQNQLIIMEEASGFSYRSNEGDLGLQGWNFSIDLHF